ncbi:targeting protein for Xklp2 [Epinephelus fuscoguttatus]|uniref:targeting protein for Xklp2 n=1 Tax=Epinephelus fuscoguttatus TaxID=293821 RepID=UPI0020CFF64C|nr:targeting protein for Xklp2 [Epinephelus fuscoguttatus]XP_049437623.1 targeting protein for Xklp2 [Epinephelus fuscoguttatus]
MAESDSGDGSERYEYDAPSHVVDFVELANAKNEDTWFEQQISAADGHLKTPLRPSLPFRRSHGPDLPRAIVPPQVKTDEESGPSASTSQPSNLVTSWGAGSPARTGARPKRKTVNQPPAQPRRVSKRKEMSSAPAPPPSKKHKKTPPVARKSRSMLHSKGQQNTRTGPVTRAAASATANTEPSSSEEQELERIRNLQKEVALHRKKNEASYKAALAGNPPPKKMALSVTVPKEFNFNTKTRAKATTSSNTSHKEVDFITQLRKPSSPAKTMKGATVPKPFNLSKGNKRGVEESAAYVPMAQQIQQFQKRTPDRYHLHSRRSVERGPSPVKGDNLKLTQPHTPHLMTRQRSRPPTVKSSAELEAEEVDRLHKFKFNALELNRKILESAECLKKPAVKEPTVPEGFELQIEKRLHERQTTKKSQEGEEKPNMFKAQPLPQRILEGVVGLPEKKVLHPTVPESPAFALKKRVRVEPKFEDVKQPSTFKAPPVPHFGLPFQPKLPENRHVEVCPFSFEEREQERRALKEKKLEEMRNEEVPQFKAQPLPDFDALVLPEKKKMEPTKPEPFRLLLDERGAVRSTRWEQMTKDEQKLEEAAAFKARPNTVTHKEPFLPKKERRAPVVVEAFELSTERRARERQEFERLASEKEALRMLMEEEMRREEEQRQKEEIARLRQEQVHIAQPIRQYKPVAVKKSEVPLTVPQSPNFSDRFRL